MNDEQTKQALITAVRSLSASSKSERQITEKLSSKGYADTAIETALAELKKSGLLNDRTFANNLAAYGLKSRGWGRYRITFELRKKGIPEPLIQDALVDIDPAEEKESAFRLAVKKMKQISTASQKNKALLQKKIYDFLARKGYDSHLARQATIHALESYES